MKKIILTIGIIILVIIGYVIYQNINITDNKQDTQKQNSKIEVVEKTEEENKTEKQEENFWEKNDCQVEQFEPLIKEKMVLNYQNNIDNIDGMVYEEFEYQGVRYILAQIGCADYTEKIFIEKKDKKLTYNTLIDSLMDLREIVKYDDFKNIINVITELKNKKTKLEKDIRYPDNCIDGACYNYLFISENEVGGIKYFVIGYNMTL